jgi:hypothetical protein
MYYQLKWGNAKIAIHSLNHNIAEPSPYQSLIEPMNLPAHISACFSLTMHRAVGNDVSMDDVKPVNKHELIEIAVS